MEAPLVSIVVPVFNSEKFISACIDSLLAQFYENFEVILVDDGSTDSSLQIMKSFEALDPRIVVLHQSNSGASSARNLALKIIKGKYVGFVDSDDVVCRHYISTLVNVAESRSVDLVLSNFFWWYPEEGRTVVHSSASSKEIAKSDFLDLVFSINLSEKIGPQGGYIANKFFRTDVLRGTFFNKKIVAAEDEFFCVDVLSKISRIYYSDVPLFYYRQHNNSLVHNEQFGFRHLDTRLELIEKVGNEFYSQAIAAYAQSVISNIGSLILSGRSELEGIRHLQRHAKKAYGYISFSPGCLKFVSPYFLRWRFFLLIYHFPAFVVSFCIFGLKFLNPRRIWNAVKMK